MPEFVLKTDDWKESARKIFYTFDCGMNCGIEGFVIMPDDELKPKGELVLEEIERLDKVENFKFNGTSKGNGLRRKRIKPENTIGDYLRNKTFKWEKRILDNKVKYTIWRIQ